jgi:hypothetical protein
VINRWSARRRFLLIAVPVLLVYVSGVFARQRYGIRVDILNEGRERLRAVRLKVGGTGGREKKYDLPELAPGAHARAYVQPVTESDISLEFTDEKGNVHVDTVMGYAEAGYCGTAISAVSSEEKVKSTSSLGCWKSWFDFM